MALTYAMTLHVIAYVKTGYVHRLVERWKDDVNVLPNPGHSRSDFPFASGSFIHAEDALSAGCSTPESEIMVAVSLAHPYHAA